MFALLTGLALATSVDIELFRPAPGERSLPGMPVPGASEKGTVEVSLSASYASNPLVAVFRDRELFPVVQDRVLGTLGIGYAVTDTVSIDAFAGLAVQQGQYTETVISGYGAAIANPSLALSWSPNRNVGARVTGWIPVGTANVWLAEASVRAAVDVYGAVDLGRVELLGRVGATLRPPVDGEWNFRLGPSLVAEPGVRVHVGGGVALWAWVATRIDRDRRSVLFAVEPMLGAQLRRGPIRVDVGVGRGVTGGYGTSDIRVLAALHGFIARRPPDEPPPPPVFVPPDVEEPPPEQVIVTVVAKLEELADRVQFEQGSARLTADGKAAVQAIALLLADAGDIVVEGHASAEGAEDFNWDLSQRRARAVFEALLEAGVSDRRVSYRGLGVRYPIAVGEDEASLAPSRRVVFLVADPTTPATVPAVEEAPVEEPVFEDPFGEDAP